MASTRTRTEREHITCKEAAPIFGAAFRLPKTRCTQRSCISLRSLGRASVRDAVPLTLRLPRRCAPRNDTKTGTFLFENGCFSSFAVIFCAVVMLCIVFQTFRSGDYSVFPQNPPDLSLRGGRIFCARRGNLKRNDLPSRNELWLRVTKQNLEIKNEEAKRCSESHVFCDRDFFLLRALVLRHGMPYL